MTGKFIHTLWLALLYAASGYAQEVTPGSFTLAHDTVAAITTGTTAPVPGSPMAQWPYVELKNTVTNTSDLGIRYGWKLLSAAMPDGWAVTGFCDNMSCYEPGGIWNVGEEMVSGNVTPGANGPLWLHIAAPVTAPDGVGIIRFTVRTTDRTDTITFVLTKAATTGISAAGADGAAVTLWPNPATGHVNLYTGQRLNPAHVTVYDVAGRMVTSQRMVPNAAATTIETGSWKNGIYTARVTDADGKLIAVRRFIKQ